MSPTWAFEFLPCRTWQFMAGILAFYVGRVCPLKNDQLNEKQSLLLSEDREKNFRLFFASTSYILIFLLTLTFIFELPDRFVNVFVIFASAVLLHFGASIEGNHLLSNFVFVWIGDLSYTIYLVHWPVIQVFRYLSTSLEFGVTREFLCF
jgi:peptidoglycan/LPS O-acetylase OafA/YrhL